MGLEKEGSRRKEAVNFLCLVAFCSSSFTALLVISSDHFPIFKNKVIADMEAQVHKLREELISVNSQRKQQLVELGLLREEEKQRTARDHEAAVNKLKAESEKMKIELKKTHAAETEMTLEKVRCPPGCVIDSRDPCLKSTDATVIFNLKEVVDLELLSS